MNFPHFFLVDIPSKSADKPGTFHIHFIVSAPLLCETQNYAVMLAKIPRKTNWSSSFIVAIISPLFIIYDIYRSNITFDVMTLVHFMCPGKGCRY